MPVKLLHPIYYLYDWLNSVYLVHEKGSLNYQMPNTIYPITKPGVICVKKLPINYLSYWQTLFIWFEKKGTKHLAYRPKLVQFVQENGAIKYPIPLTIYLIDKLFHHIHYLSIYPNYFFVPKKLLLAIPSHSLSNHYRPE